MNRKADKSNPPAAGARAGRGFTLIELMVSIALVLILILGINQVFKIASDTVNVGQAMSGAAREDRGIQGTMFPDMQNAVVTGAPFFIIRSRVQPAFRNRPDELADADGNPYTADIDGNNKEGENVPGEVTSAVTYNSRNHRLDKLQFFANYLYRRQTGVVATGQLQSNYSTNEAYITYGHLKVGKNRAVPTDPASYFLPGEADKPTGTNDNNRYASDWILGRNVILLSPAAERGQFRRPPSAPILDLSPLVEAVKTDDGKFLFQSSVSDVAQTSISDYRLILSRFITRGPTSGAGTWWQTVSGFRFQGYPYPVRPLRTETIAQTVPVFVRGCTQFIVEYAGDYLQQEPTNGAILGTVFGTPPLSDGVVDFIVVPTPGNPPGAPGQRRIRWYGAPRNVYTDDDKPGQPVVFGNRSPEFMRDVVPLRDVLKAQKVTPPADFFEREIDNRVKPQTDYGTLAVPTGPSRGNTPFVSPLIGSDLNEYVAAWGPNDLRKGSNPDLRPKMIRITLVVDDPAGRMTEGQTFEYVFTLP